MNPAITHFDYDMSGPEMYKLEIRREVENISESNQNAVVSRLHKIIKISQR